MARAVGMLIGMFTSRDVEVEVTSEKEIEAEVTSPCNKDEVSSDKEEACNSTSAGDIESSSKSIGDTGCSSYSPREEACETLTTDLEASPKESLGLESQLEPVKDMTTVEEAKEDEELDDFDASYCELSLPLTDGCFECHPIPIPPTADILSKDEVKTPVVATGSGSSDGGSGTMATNRSCGATSTMGLLLGMFSSRISEATDPEANAAEGDGLERPPPPSPQLQELRQAVERAEAAGVSSELLEHVRAKLEELEHELARDVKVYLCHSVSGELAAMVRARPCDTVCRLREGALLSPEFAELNEHGLAAIKFIFGSQLLDESITLAEAGIRDGDTVNIVRTPLRCLTASFDGTVRLWQLRGKDEDCSSCSRCFREDASLSSGPVLSAALAPGGSTLLTVASGGEGQLWCAATGAVLGELEGPAATGEFSPGGLHVVGASSDDEARIWCAASGRCVTSLHGHTGEVRAARFSPDGRLVLTGAGDGTAALWDSSTGKCLSQMEGHADVVKSVTFSSDTVLAATASTDGCARVWSIPSGKCLQTFHGHEKALSSVSFSPDRSRLLTAAFDGTARIWDTATGDCILILPGDNKVVNDAVFSPDGQRVLIASASECLRMFHADTGECILTMCGHDDWVRAAAFSPDGMFIASASYDGTARIWNGLTGECLRVLQGHNGAVISVAFVED